MMALIFALMTGALIAGWLGRRGLAVAGISVALLLATGLFLWEIDSPQYGFGMPWIDL